MFTQRISMDCTKEQYEKYLKDQLLKMGYKETEIDGLDWADDFIIVNDFIELGRITQLANANKDTGNRTYLGSFNPKLFLALAAMTDKEEGNYGEYVMGLRSGKIYKMTEKDRILPEYTLIRKATKEEIMARFGDVKIDEKTEYPLDVTCETANGILSHLYYKIDQYHITALKSKGYKILKPKTWEEV